MTESYTSCVWLVREGEADAFVAAWREFVAAALAWPGWGEAPARSRRPGPQALPDLSPLGRAAHGRLRAFTTSS